jgi:uncharacterized protein
MTSAEYVQKLQLQPHPEGGFYKETYRATENILAAGLPARFSGGDRSFATAIYYLLEQGDFSGFHRIRSDEGWHFYAGGPLLVHVILPQGNYYCVRLGNNLNNQEVFQFVVPAMAWFASEPAPKTDFSLVGCTVAPGFDFKDFEMADKSKLRKAFPEHTAIIQRLCRE